MAGLEARSQMPAGPGLVFVVYPEGLSTMPIPPLWSVLFFLMMTMLGFSSEFSYMENFFSSFADEFPTAFRSTRKRNILFRLGFCIFFYLISLTMVTRGGFYLVNLVDTYVGGFPLLIVGLGELVAMQYIYGYKNFADDIQMMLGKKPNFVIQWTWKLVSPLLLLAITVFKAWQYRPLTLFETYQYPGWAGAIAWGLVALPLVFLPVLGCVNFCRFGGWEGLKNTAKPTPGWGPSLPVHRKGRYESRDTEALDDLWDDIPSYGEVNQAFQESTNEALTKM